MLLDSHRYGEWADARFTSFDPPGPVVLGQVMEAQARELGLSFRVRLRVAEVDPGRHRVMLEVELPFGVRERTTISSSAVDERRTHVQYG